MVTRPTPDDAGELLTLQRAAFLAEARLNGSLDLPPLTETVPEILTALDRETVLVARLRGRLVASVRGSRRPEGRWYVGRLVVAPDWQGQGIGSLMMDLIEELAPAGTKAHLAVHRGGQHAQPGLLPAPRLRRDRAVAG